MNLLHVDSSILGPASVSRGLSATIVEAWKRKNPSSKIIYRDLADDPISHLDGALLLAAAIDPRSAYPGNQEGIDRQRERNGGISRSRRDCHRRPHVQLRYLQPA